MVKYFQAGMGHGTVRCEQVITVISGMMGNMPGNGSMDASGVKNPILTIG
jgi:hypothetical protein